jgi:hypothetical protein
MARPVTSLNGGHMRLCRSAGGVTQDVEFALLTVPPEFEHSHHGSEPCPMRAKVSGGGVSYPALRFARMLYENGMEHEIDLYRAAIK